MVLLEKVREVRVEDLLVIGSWYQLCSYSEQEDESWRWLRICQP